jgi:hypothetical protein
VTGCVKGAPSAFQSGISSGVHDRARQDVRAGLGAFFEHDDRQLGAFFGGQLLQANGRRQPARAAADHDHDHDHDHVVVHRFSGSVLGQDVCWNHDL